MILLFVASAMILVAGIQLENWWIIYAALPLQIWSGKSLNLLENE